MPVEIRELVVETQQPSASPERPAPVAPSGPSAAEVARVVAVTRIADAVRRDRLRAD